MFHACATRFDVTGNFKNFLVFRVNNAQGENVPTQDEVARRQRRSPCAESMFQSQNQKLFKISHYIESCGTCIKYQI